MENSEIGDRIIRILKEEKLTSSKFADILGVQPSGISHIISGRNKPSLDFLQKILTHFRELNALWLIIGEGEMYKPKIVSQQKKINFDLLEGDKKDNASLPPYTSNSQGLNNEDKNTPIIEQKIENEPRSIKKIIVFYSDNSFEEFLQK